MICYAWASILSLHNILGQLFHRLLKNALKIVVQKSVSVELECSFILLILDCHEKSPTSWFLPSALILIPCTLTCSVWQGSYPCFLTLLPFCFAVYYCANCCALTMILHHFLLSECPCLKHRLFLYSSNSIPHFAVLLSVALSIWYLDI